MIQAEQKTGQSESHADSYRRKMGELIQLPKDVERKLKSWLAKRIDEWLEDSADLHEQLREDNDLVEGIVPETNFPWEGSCQSHLPIVETHMKVFKGVARRSTLGSGSTWTADVDPETAETVDGIQEVVPKISNALNWLTRHKWNIVDCLKNVYWTTPRDRLGIMKITWAEEYSPTTDVVLVGGQQEFVERFPDYESAGLDEQEYLSMFEQAANATPDNPIEVPISIERCDYYGCKGEVVELVDFVTIPSVVPDIRHESCVGYGHRFTERRGVIKKKGKDGNYSQEAVTRILKKTKSGSSELSESRQAKEEIDGIQRTKSYELENYELAVKLDLSSFGGKEDFFDGYGEKKYLVTYNKEHNEILALRPFPYRVDNVALFKIEEKPNALLGRGIPQQSREVSELIDATTRQRVNSRTISHVPTFIGDSAKKAEFERLNPDKSFYPGKQFWAPGGVLGFDQFKIQPTDMGEGMADEVNWMKMLDLRLGSNISVISGQVVPGDPNAPGNKTAMMISQSNLRMEEPLDTLRKGIDQVGQICVSHLYQFGPNKIGYKESGEDGKEIPAVFEKKFLRVGVRVRMSSVTVADNPEAEMNKWLMLHSTLMQTYAPYAQNPEAQTYLLRHALNVGNIAIADKIVPTIQAVQQKQIETQKAAMVQMAMEQKVKEVQAAQAQQEQAKDALAARIGAVKQEAEIRRVAEAQAGQNLGGGPEDVR